MPPNYLKLAEDIEKALPMLQTYQATISQRTQTARELLLQYSNQVEYLREKVFEAVSYDSRIRCALPIVETLSTEIPLPSLPREAVLVATDGSQINPDRHAATIFGLLNFSSISIQAVPDLGSEPEIQIDTELLIGESLYLPGGGSVNDELIALSRDTRERVLLAEKCCERSFSYGLIDGPLEVWKSSDPNISDSYLDSVENCRKAFTTLAQSKRPTAGYVDRPRSELVTRLLEIAIATPADMKNISNFHPLLGVTDRSIYSSLIPYGSRSAFFKLQTASTGAFYDSEDLGIHFFYLNVGYPGQPWLIRIEVPGWLCKPENRELLNNLHALIMQQCRVFDSSPYPYILTRAHEEAVVTMNDRTLVEGIIEASMLENGLFLGTASQKQTQKGFIS